MVATDVLTSAPTEALEPLTRSGKSLVPIDIRRWARSDELAQRCFRNYVAIASVLLVARFGQRRWFFADDWFMLAGRDGGDISSILEPHNEHLMATVVVIYRVLFNVFGLRWTPFLVCVVATHVALVCVVRALLRRLGVSEWTSVVVAGALVMFGAGEENILWSIQISWNCALIFGFLQLRAADRVGPLGRRDVLGVACGFVALVSASSIGLSIVAITAVVAVVQGQPRRAAVHAAPIVTAYAAWVIAFEPESPAEPGGPPLATALRWASKGYTGPISALAQHSVVAVALGAVVVAGLGVSVRAAGSSWWRQNAVALSMAAASPLLFLLIGWQRWRYGSQMADAPRYLYVSAILLAPLLAIAIDALARFARPVGVAAGALVLSGIPQNVALMDNPGFGTSTYDHERQVILGFARDPMIEELPGWVALRTGPFDDSAYNVDWLRATRDEGRLPPAGTIDSEVTNEFPLRFGLVERPETDFPLAEHCRSEADAFTLALERGDELWVDDIVYGEVMKNGESISRRVAFIPVRGRSMKLTVIVSALTVRFASPNDGEPPQVCVAS